MLSRINLSMHSLTASLGATIYDRAMLEDLDGIAEPVSDLGKQHIAWVRERGLPFGLEHHDHA